ncbi:MAG: cyclodeaminase/cyclohydrolase family protein [Deltaproteobacteria bacterium]|jgi:formiminotetrahydrofolate cyclodeaminase|nr:cyclodeaminase/cyclohydrolase family protein [Deltaproteobacteria bacterium]
MGDREHAMNTNYEVFYNKPLTEILDLASSKSHVPGGGSVSAISATLGSSMGAMVANLTIGKPGYEDRAPEVSAILKEMVEGIEEIKRLTLADMQAFDSLLLAYRLPRATEDEKSKRREEIDKNTILAATVPLKISQKARDLLLHNKRLSEIGNGGVVNDCAVACILLESAARAAMLSVDVNLDSIKDEVVKKEISAKKEEVLKDSKKAMEETLAVVASRDKKL